MAALPFEDAVKDAVLAYNVSDLKLKEAGASLRQSFVTYSKLLQAYDIVRELIVSELKSEWQDALRECIPPQSAAEDPRVTSTRNERLLAQKRISRIWCRKTRQSVQARCSQIWLQLQAHAFPTEYRAAKARK
jgi:hypothetical protein